MEAVAADAPFVAPVGRQRIRRRLVGHRPVERCVEDCHVRDVRKRRTRRLDRGQRLSLMERREVGNLVERSLHAVVHDNGVAEAGAAVHEAMRNGIDLRPRIREGLDRP